MASKLTNSYLNDILDKVCAYIKHIHGPLWYECFIDADQETFKGRWDNLISKYPNLAVRNIALYAIGREKLYHIDRKQETKTDNQTMESTNRIESVNRVELVGRIGQEPKIKNVSNRQVCKFTLATEEIYKDRTGTVTIETTWHSICVWDNDKMPIFSNLHKGMIVHIHGRLKAQKYVSSNGDDAVYTEILANKLAIISEN